ncbi:MAG: GH92 family glycosyl hydrolase [Bacteroidaceae bacterium]|nr:GH92 family glycosyl hydrolase [Bacteroidaceae bacterium]
MFLRHSFFTLLWICVAFTADAQQVTAPVDYVNPFVGTTNFGTCNPGAITPWGMMSVSPFNVMGSDANTYDKDARWWSTPYDHTNSFFTGFSHVNLSGVGCPELGGLLLMPTQGKLEVDYAKYGSQYKQETASPGYYSTYLTHYNILAEATATPRVGVSRFTFPAGESNLILNLGASLSNETGAYMRWMPNGDLQGMRMMGTFCYHADAVFPIYFVMRVNKAPQAKGYWKKQPELKGVEAEWDVNSGKRKIYSNYHRDIAGDDIGAWLTYQTKANETVEVSIAVSFVSIENARLNLEQELHQASFETIRSEARAAWNKELSKIKVEGGTKANKEVFYTALYHALLHPNVLNDVNGDYITMGQKSVGHMAKGDRYTVFSLWDTYRNLHQLLTLVYPERQMDMVHSMLGMYKENGWLPKWELYSQETYTMEGDPAIPVLVDTWKKGLRDFDIHEAYQAMRKGAFTPGKENPLRPDNDAYMRLGYVPLTERYDNSVSHALEYYVADYALATLAEELGEKEDAKILYKRSLGYANYFSKADRMMRPKLADGTFFTPFNSLEGADFEPCAGFHEGTAWNYAYYVPHDIPRLIKRIGGQKKFVAQLQQVFDKGWYDPANEPNIAYPYLFSRCKGEEWRTQKEVKRLLDRYFTTKPDGIPGNDDAGTMSTWAIFSMMGIYPDCPGVPMYTVTSPVFDKITIELNQNYYSKDKLVIEKTSKKKDGFIRRVSLQGKKAGFRISHHDLLEAGSLQLSY